MEYVRGNYNPSSATVEDYYDLRDTLYDEVLQRFLADPDGKQRWVLLPYPRPKKIWRDFAKTGFVRDEKGMQAIADIVVENIAKVDINSEITGHTESDPTEEIRERSGVDDIDIDKLYEYLRDDDGTLRISDYAMNDLWTDAARILESENAEEQLVSVDRALNRIHMRSDIAEWFIKGGTLALSDLSGTGEFDD